MHEAPDGERGAVLDVAARVISPGSQLVQRSAGIKNARIVSGRNQNAVPTPITSRFAVSFSASLVIISNTTVPPSIFNRNHYAQSHIII